MPSCRILIVDDCQPWRRFVSDFLGDIPDWRIVGEAENGFDAVLRSAELEPDLILLDMNLPFLDGIAAAYRIRRIAPSCKILFVSENSQPEMVQAALVAGARGYVVKSDAASELLPAMQAVIANKNFVGSRFAGYKFVQPAPGADVSNSRSSGRRRRGGSGAKTDS